MKTATKQADGFKGQEFYTLPRSVIQSLDSYPLTAPLHLCHTGFFPRARHHYIDRPEGYPDHILIYCSDGAGWYRIAGRDHPMKRDSLLLIPTGLPHAYGAEETDPWSIHWITFAGENATEYIRHLDEGTHDTPVAPTIKPQLLSLFQEIYSTLRLGQSMQNLIYASKVLEHILGLVFFKNEALATGGGVSQYRGIQQSIHFMRHHLDRNPTLRELAEQAHMSVTQYWRVFSKQTGYPPMDYFIRLKTQLACQYLATTTKPLKVIADYLGYEDYYYFSRVFSRIMGIPPTEYRSKMSAQRKTPAKPA